MKFRPPFGRRPSTAKTYVEFEPKASVGAPTRVEADAEHFGVWNERHSPNLVSSASALNTSIIGRMMSLEPTTPASAGRAK